MNVYTSLFSVAATSIAKKVATKKDLADELNFLDQSRFALKIPFDVDPKRLKKLLKSSTIIRSIEISESKCDRSNWTTISEGIAKNKSISELRFHSLDITHDNIAYITDIVRGNKGIESIRFDNWTILPPCFEDLCQAIKETPKLAEIEISRDNLTEEQLERLKSCLESSPNLKHFSTFRDPIYIADTKSLVSEFTERKMKFIIAGIKAIRIDKSDPINKYWADAVKSCQTLATIELESLLFIRQWKYINEGISGNYSVTKLKLLDTRLDVSTAPFFFEIFSQNDRITNLVMKKVNIAEDASSLIVQVVRSKKLQSVKILDVECTDEEALIEAACSNTNITKLVLKNHTPKILNDVIYNCQHLTDLEITFGEFPPYSSAGQQPTIDHLTRLDINLANHIPTSLLLAIKSSRSLKELNIASDENLFKQADFSEIFCVNTTLTKLALLMPSDESDWTIFSNGFMKNRSLKVLGVELHQLESIQSLCSAIVSHHSVEQLAIRIPQTLKPNILSAKEYYQSVGEVFAKNRTLRSIKLPIIADYEWFGTMCLKMLRENDTLTHLDLITVAQTLTNRPIWNWFKKHLSRNRAINRVTITGEVHKDVIQFAQENLRRQKEFISKTFAMVNMMKLRQEIFESMLPIEIWVIIFKRIRHPGVPIDFSRELVNILNK